MVRLGLALAIVATAACYRDVGLGTGSADAPRAPGDGPGPIVDGQAVDAAPIPCLHDEFDSGSSPDPQVWTSTDDGVDRTVVTGGDLELSALATNPERSVRVTSVSLYAPLDIEVHVPEIPGDGAQVSLVFQDSTGANGIRLYASGGTMTVTDTFMGGASTFGAQCPLAPFWRLSRGSGEQTLHVQTGPDGSAWTGSVAAFAPVQGVVELALTATTGPGTTSDVAGFDYVRTTCE